MPPKAERNVAVAIKPEDLVLHCEWRDCNEVFSSMSAFTEHANVHLMQHFNSASTPNTDDESGGQQTGTQCHWRECSSDVDGEPACYLRHVYFHLFHVKIKCVGSLLLEKTGRQACMLESESRNMIPELPECLECGWEECHVRFENADLFYRHVQSHTDSFPDGNAVKGGCKCLWEGCHTATKSKHKLKDHLKSHTQEKVVACPTCGALFSCRTKFFDHLTRQSGYSTGKQYQCSHCNSTFGAERLLRDHMRYHVNQYKCPYCDMTSPAPSNIQLHIKYRHTEEKPFKCDICDYKAKTQTDLKRHQATHSDDEPIRCQVPDCQYTAKSFRSLENHFRRIHESENVSIYECHVCSSSFTRGAQLSKHLKSKHKFNWPSGHSRFRYKRDVDGKWRLQTVRYESMELTTSEDSNTLNTDNSASNSSLNNASTFKHYKDMPKLTNSDTNADDGSTFNMNDICFIKVIPTIDKHAEESAKDVIDDSDAEAVESNMDTDNDGFDNNGAENDEDISHDDDDDDDDDGNNESQQNMIDWIAEAAAQANTDEDDTENDDLSANEGYSTDANSNNNNKNNNSERSRKRRREIQSSIRKKIKRSKSGDIYSEIVNTKSVQNQLSNFIKKKTSSKEPQKGDSTKSKVRTDTHATVGKRTQQDSGSKNRSRSKCKNTISAGETSANTIDETDPAETAVTIHIITNSDGEYELHREDGAGKGQGPIDLPENMNLQEETMYNLQMLGEVALQKQGKTSDSSASC